MRGQKRTSCEPSTVLCQGLEWDLGAIANNKSLWFEAP